ncbi:MAG TPA: DUF222 domain-containing protein, partial [Mycobacteriales bacterium]|nr:DUF222 domain-containing protein [Mycobacteriales bacterium]
MRTMTPGQLRVQAAEAAAEVLFDSAGYQEELAAQREYAEQESRHYAAAAVRLAAVTAQVPRYCGDHSGGTAWTSHLREVAVSRRWSDVFAYREIELACALVTHFPATLALLASGAMPIYSARTLIERCAGVDPERIEQVAAAVEAAVAQNACTLPPARIRRAVDRVLTRLGARTAIERAKRAAEDRFLWMRNEPDGQMSATL